MDIVVIFNGLGNQMSQYAFYQKKKAINKNTYAIDFCREHNGFELGRIFNINLQQTLLHKFLYLLFRILLTQKVVVLRPLQWVLNLLNCRVIKEEYNYNFNEAYLVPSKGITFYYGGWPSEKYFIDIKEQIVSQYTFSEPSDPETLAYVADMKSTNSIALHVRRGDYLHPANIKLFGEVCTKGYFEKAINVIETKVSDPCFYVFSNDIDWVKANLQISNVKYVTHNQKQASWKDLYLMSICKNNIISNSSFSWWAAWLNKNPDKIVISPSRYLNNDLQTDFYAHSWIKLSNY